MKKFWFCRKTISRGMTLLNMWMSILSARERSEKDKLYSFKLYIVEI